MKIRPQSIVYRENKRKVGREEGGKVENDERRSSKVETSKYKK